MSQSPAQLWTHKHTLTEYQVWQPIKRICTIWEGDGFDLQEAFGLHRVHEGLVHIGTAKIEVSPAQVLQYKQAALSRSAPELPSNLRVDIEHLFPDSADEVGKAWTKTIMMDCVLCVPYIVMDTAKTERLQ
ncbi:hypothetical protein CCR75_008011 [Bremia lactucae]|uniref:Uncharacterized protein n=1 Tax=Bremia lactucae TaxID=4779 RepID=A0A976FET4_BRELC|nr:hypothetical protein CCR75_008011 [Bremia lactucae]